MKPKLAWLPPSADSSDDSPPPEPPTGRGTVLPFVRPSDNVGVLVMVLDHAPNPRSVRAVGELAGVWRGREAVFLAAAVKRVGLQVCRLIPGVFYNTEEPLDLTTVWQLLPWRLVVGVRDGRVWCWSPQPETPKRKS